MRGDGGGRSGAFNVSAIIGVRACVTKSCRVLSYIVSWGDGACAVWLTIGREANMREYTQFIQCESREWCLLVALYCIDLTKAVVWKSSYDLCGVDNHTLFLCAFFLYE